ncbi:MAG: chitobiase/beta-hexosaminidase C-terminal domain-containing protein [Methanobacteriaceae archaeon]|nr:chitobiase/beta-hexosaminidase C-terminal domain-containing protein [Methanobacteriaceae archaeon]
MFNIKKIIIFLVLVLLSCSVVCATTINNNTNIQSQNKHYETVNNNTSDNIEIVSNVDLNTANNQLFDNNKNYNSNKVQLKKNTNTIQNIYNSNKIQIEPLNSQNNNSLQQYDEEIIYIKNSSTDYIKIFSNNHSSNDNNILINNDFNKKNNISSNKIINTDFSIYITNNSDINQYNVDFNKDSKVKIYYTIDGTTPTINSSFYNESLQISKNAVLSFISVKDGVSSQVYSYQTRSVTPLVTITNVSEVQYNRQNITMQSNVPGTIYYTIDGTNPTIASRIYTTGQIIEISIKTQLKAIVKDSTGKISTITFYQPPQEITAPFTIIKAITSLTDNNRQQVQFKTNKASSTIYFTTDGTNPKTSTTVQNTTSEQIITIARTTQLKYYTKNNIGGFKSEIYTYLPPQNHTASPQITIYNTTKLFNNNIEKIMIQSNIPGTIYYTTTGEIATIQHMKYTNEMSIHKNTLLNLLVVDNSNQTFRYQYKYNTPVERIININYTIAIPTYVNITLPQVAYYSPSNSIYNNFIVKTGTNGIVKMPCARVIQITIQNKEFNFYHKYNINNGYDLSTNAYFVPLNTPSNTPTTCTPTTVITKNGILIYATSDEILIKYYNIAKKDLNQFTINYQTTFKQVNNGMNLFEDTTYNLNDQDTATVSFSGILGLDDGGVRYQLKNQYNYRYNDWKTVSLQQLCNGNTPQIKYTRLNIPINITDINSISKLGDCITTTATTNQNTITQDETITYSGLIEPEVGFEAIQTFAITTKKITTQIIQTYINKNNQYTNGAPKARYGTFMTALTTIWLNDKYADEEKNNYTIIWDRTTDTTAACGSHIIGGYVTCPDTTMGMKLYSTNITQIKNFRFITSIMLSQIEKVALNFIRQTTQSTIATLFAGILNQERFSTIQTGKYLTIQLDNDTINNPKIKINMETGQVTDTITQYNNQYHGAISNTITDCFHSSLTDFLISGLLNTIQKSILAKSLINEANYITQHPGTTLEMCFLSRKVIKGALKAINFVVVGTSVGLIDCLDMSVGLMIVEGELVLFVKDNYIPENTWQYISYHHSLYDHKSFHFINTNTHMTDHIEVPYDENTHTYDRTKAIYI